MIYTNENWKPPVTHCEPNKVEVQRMTREEAIEHLKEWREVISSGNRKAVIDMAIKALQVEPKHGEWKITEAYPHIVYCSECHRRYAQTNWQIWNDEEYPLPRNYCPQCGAKMDKEKEK